MSYQPLHHKYRPQSFADLVGQEAIATTLSNALYQQRIAPAYLFTGARGTGKTSSARILAKSLNCLQSDVPTAIPCGVCEVCRSIANGSALDVIEIDAASNTGVDHIRELIERAQFAPVQCRYKVYVIDECHMLSAASFNALLKTLEEPPDRVVFVLATTDPQRVLPTIISRCQRFDFRRIPLDAMVQHLRKIADQEGIAITDEAIALVGQISQGGLRDAESLLDQLSLLAGEVTVEKVWDLVGAVPERDLMALLSAIAANHPEALLDTARRLMDRGREPLIVLQNLASFYRDLLIAKTAPDRSDLVAITAPTWATLCEFAQKLDISTILLGQQHLRASEAQLKHTTQPRLWLEVTLMGLLPSALPIEGKPDRPAAPTPPPTQPKPQPPAPQPAEQRSPELPAPHQTTPNSANGDQRFASPPVLPEPDSTQEPIEPAAVEFEPEQRSAAIDPPRQPTQPLAPDRSNLDEVWQKVIRQVQPFSTQVMVRQQCHLLSFDGQVAHIGVSSQPLLKMAQAKLPHIEKAFQQVFGDSVRLLLEVAAPPPQANAASPPAPPPPQTYQPPPAPPPYPSSQLDSPRARSSSALSEFAPPPIDSADAPPNSPEGSWQQEDEATRAAHQLADFFGGKVVEVTDGDMAASDPSPEAANQTEPNQPDASDTWDETDVDDNSVPF
jgi:DNA polymerase-3 subunit gamma/tau